MIAAGLGVRDTIVFIRDRFSPDRPSVGRLITHALVASAAFTVAMFLGLGEGDAQPGDVIGLLGLVVTVILTLSSTTFVTNAMAGLALNVIRNFRPGDYLEVGGHFGRVTEQEFLHVEIQTPDRTLTTFPNLFLIQNPVNVIPASGTLVSAEVSLGYDVDHVLVARVLETAANSAGLEGAFVHVRELGDFSILYRVAGLLTDVGQLLTARSKLRECMLDALHGANIEIVSPTYMNQRRDDGPPALPEASFRRNSEPAAATAEAMAFDKANRATVIKQLGARSTALAAEIEELTEERKSADKDDYQRLDLAVAQRKAHQTAIAALIERMHREGEEAEAGETT